MDASRRQTEMGENAVMDEPCVSGFSVDNQQVFFTSSEDLSFLPEESVNFFLTSPPYWNLRDYGSENEIGKEDYRTYIERLCTVWGECYRLATADAVLIVNVSNRRHKKRYYPIGMDITQAMEGWVLWDTLIWYVPNSLPQPRYYKERLFDNRYEFLLVFTKDGSTDYGFHKPRVPQKYAGVDLRPDKYNPEGRCLGNIIRVPAYRPPYSRSRVEFYPAAYPQELVALLVECFTLESDVILDPFLGSGTTLKVARNMGRKGIGIELNPNLESLIRGRLEEPFSMPDWKDLDLTHSSGMPGEIWEPRK